MDSDSSDSSSPLVFNRDSPPLSISPPPPTTRATRDDDDFGLRMKKISRNYPKLSRTSIALRTFGTSDQHGSIGPLRPPGTAVDSARRKQRASSGRAVPVGPPTSGAPSREQRSSPPIVPVHPHGTTKFPTPPSSVHEKPRERRSSIAAVAGKKKKKKSKTGITPEQIRVVVASKKSSSAPASVAASAETPVDDELFQQLCEAVEYLDSLPPSIEGRNLTVAAAHRIFSKLVRMALGDSSQKQQLFRAGTRVWRDLLE